MAVKYLSALYNGQYISIKKVLPGLACNCYCLECNERMIARKGLKRTWHFAHYKNHTCGLSPETACHKMAKALLKSLKVIMLPAVYVSLGQGSGKYKIMLYQMKSIPFDEVYLEKEIGNIRPDAIMQVNEHRHLAIEIVVCNPVSSAKKEKIIQNRISTLQIDLREQIDRMGIVEIEKVIRSEIQDKFWVYNNRVCEFEKIIENVYSRHIPAEKRASGYHIPNCPLAAKKWLGTPYADLDKDCTNCKYCFGLAKNEFVYCLGFNEKEMNQWINMRYAFNPSK
jgi:hypothetical protein